MKEKLTRKDLFTLSENVYYCGYCDLAWLLSSKSRIGYNCGIYGWNWDAFMVDGVIINTGYRNMAGKKIPHEMTVKYEILVTHFHNKYSYYKAAEIEKKLLSRFVRELVRGVN